MTPTFHALGATRHAQRYWRRYNSYQWAVQTTLAPLYASELGAAAMHLPIAFIEQGDQAVMVAVMGLEPAVNVFVGGDGRWIGGYVPAVLRMRPFALLPAADGQRVLCVDEAAAEITEVEGLPDTEPFFTSEGELSPALRQVMEFVSRIEDAKAPTTAAVAVLKQQQLLVPWEIALETDAGPRKVDGLWRVDEAAIAQLADDAFLELRRANALPLLYAHLLSLQHIGLLAQLTRARALAMQQQKVMPVTKDGELDLSFMNAGDTLRFS